MYCCKQGEGNNMKPKKMVTLFDKSQIYDFDGSYCRIYKNGKIEFFQEFRLMCKKNNKNYKYIDNVRDLVIVDGGILDG